MKFVIGLVLLLLGVSAQASTCPDGRPDIGEGCSGVIESIAFSAVGETGFTVTVDLDKGPASSMYVYTHLAAEPPGCAPGTSASNFWLCTDYESIRVGSGALVRKVNAAVDGTQDFVFTDLPCGTTIYAVAFDRGTFGEYLQPSKPVVASQATSSCSGGGGGGGGEEPDLNNQVYIFDENHGSCSDLNQGQDKDNPWCSTAALDGFNVAGADFLFMDGGVYDEKLVVPVSGVDANNLSRFSSGYVNTTTGKLLWYEQGDGVGRGAMAKFVGDINPAQRTAGTVNYNATPTIQTSIYDATIRVDQKDYVEISYLRCEYAWGSCVGLSGSGPFATGTAKHIIVKHNEFSITGFTPVTAVNGVQNVAFMNNMCEFGSDCENQERTGGTVPNPAIGTCGRAGWPGACVVFARSPNTQSLVSSNEIHQGRGEGINCLNNTTYMVVQDNITSELLSNSIYFDGCAYGVAEYNLALGGGDGEIVVNVENSVQNPPVSEELIVRNNLSAGASTGVTIRMQASKRDEGETLEIDAWHNTFVSKRRDINYELLAANVKSASAAGNIFAATTLTHSNRSSVAVGPNHFGIAPADTDLQHVDNTTGAAAFVTSQATLLASDRASPVDASDFELGGGSPVGTAPLSLVTTDGIADADNYGDFVFEQMTIQSITSAADRAKWEKKAKFCINTDGTIGERSDSVASDFGAICP